MGASDTRCVTSTGLRSNYEKDEVVDRPTQPDGSRYHLTLSNAAGVRFCDAIYMYNGPPISTSLLVRQDEKASVLFEWWYKWGVDGKDTVRGMVASGNEGVIDDRCSTGSHVGLIRGGSSHR